MAGADASARNGGGHTTVNGIMKNFEFIFAAYVVGWAVFFVYYLTVAGRLNRVERELRRLKERLGQSHPGSLGRE